MNVRCLSLILLLLCSAIPLASAAGNAKIYLSPADASWNTGQTVQVTVMYNNNLTPVAKDISLYFDWNADILKYESCDFKVGRNTVAGLLSSHELNVMVGDTTNGYPTGDYPLAVLTFKVIGPGDTPILIRVARLNDMDGKPATSVTGNGLYSISGDALPTIPTTISTIPPDIPTIPTIISTTLPPTEPPTLPVVITYTTVPLPPYTTQPIPSGSGVGTFYLEQTKSAGVGQIGIVTLYMDNTWQPAADDVWLTVNWNGAVLSYISTDWKVGNSVSATLNGTNSLFMQMADFTNKYPTGKVAIADINLKALTVGSSPLTVHVDHVRSHPSGAGYVDMTPSAVSLTSTFTVGGATQTPTPSVTPIPIVGIWPPVDPIRVGDVTTMSIEETAADFGKPTELEFFVRYDPAHYEITSVVFDSTLGSSFAQRISNDTLLLTVNDYDGSIDDIADLYVRGIAPGDSAISFEIQKYGYTMGGLWYDRRAYAADSSVPLTFYQPYGQHSVPCRIEAEDYDVGPNGFAYHDTTAGNSGGAYRTDDVDVSQMPGGGYNIGYVADGEWLTYSINVPEGYGDWNAPPVVNLRVASWKDNSQIKLINGYNECIVNVPNTKNAWTLIPASMCLDPGSSTFKIEFIGTGLILDYIEFVESTPIPRFWIRDMYGFFPPASVTFTDESINLPTTWEWAFGDGTMSTERSPTHTYTHSGRYQVTLKVTNNAGTASLSKTVDILTPLPSEPEHLLSRYSSDYYAEQRMSGENVLYLEDGSLRLYNVTTEDTRYIPTSKTPVSFDIDGDWIAWSNGEYDSLNNRPISNVYLYNIVRGQETRVTSSYSASNPSVNGGKVVYQDDRNGNFDIYLYDIAGGRETVLCSESHDQTFPSIDSDTVVWQDYRLGHERVSSASMDGADYESTSNIYSYSISAGTGRLLSDLDTHQESPQISGTRVVWLDGRAGREYVEMGHYSYFSDVYMFDLASNRETVVKELENAYVSDCIRLNCGNARISDGIVVWEYGWGDGPALGIFNANTNQEYQIDSGQGSDVSGNRIIYADFPGDIWLLTLPVASTTTPTSDPDRPAIIPGGSDVPGDLDGDHAFEDVNGNGRKDFADVVLYFNQMTWIGANEPAGMFDYNGNGRIDFADVVWLFNHL